MKKQGTDFTALLQVIIIASLVFVSCRSHVSPPPITGIDDPAAGTPAATCTNTPTESPEIIVSSPTAPPESTVTFTATSQASASATPSCTTSSTATSSPVVNTVTGTATATRTNTGIITPTSTITCTYIWTPLETNTPTPLPFLCTPADTPVPVVSGTGSISGNVKYDRCDDVYNFPGAIVKAFAAGVEVQSTLSDNSGNYVLSGLGTGTYEVFVKVPGYDNGNFISGVNVTDGVNTAGIDYIKTLSWSSGTLIVRFASGVSDEQARQIINNHCCTVIQGPGDFQFYYYIQVYEEDGQTTAGMIPVFQAEPIQYVQANYIYCP